MIGVLELERSKLWFVSVNEWMIATIDMMSHYVSVLSYYISRAMGRE